MSEELTVHLSTDALIEENVRRSADGFSFVDTAASLANNRSFLDGYRHFKLGQHDDKSYVWDVLSAIGDSTSEVIYNNVINFVDNASNIDLCKIAALQSILSGFGLQYNIVDSYDFLPLEVKQLIDVLSINKKYLLRSDVLKQSLINDISSNTYVSTTTDADGYIDDTRYASYLSCLFTNLINSIINSVYVDELSSVKVYQKIANELLYDNVESTIDSQSMIATLKTKYGLYDFNEGAIADDIDDGSDSIENYSGIKATILGYELSSRAAAKYAVYPETRYAYYEEQKVKSYFNFLKNKYFSVNSSISASTSYSADSNYYVYEAQPKIQFIKYVDSTYIDNEKLSAYIGKYALTSKAEKFVDDGYYAYDEVLGLVVQNLVDTTLTIADIREKAKLSLQKSYTKGTFNLLSYVVNEYLIEYAKSNIALSQSESGKKIVDMLKKHVQNDIELIEYYDTTEYFNLSTDVTSKAKNKKHANDRFWEEETDQANSNSNSNFAFAEEQIEQFYLSTLSMQSKLPAKQSSLMSFLSTVYAAGANRSYVDSSGSKVISTTSALSADSEDMFNRFYGADRIGNVPYYNHKNVTHASYQVHPYLYKFIETSQYDESITNAFFNDINQQLEDTQVLSSLDEHVGAYGEVINIALNNDYDYSGYKTRYEVSNHEIATSARGAKNMVIDYDGAFYPPAAAEFLADPDKCIESLSVDSKMHSTDGDTKTFYEKYYSHLNLVPAQRKNIAAQLNEYRDVIVSIISEKASKAEVYDIYKYGRDAYDNSYILYKKYASDTPSVKEKRDARGELWIRLSNHPIAFPAFAGKLPQVDYSTTEKYNNLLDLILKHKVGDSSYSSEPAQYFYDLELDDTKRYVVLPYYPINHPTLSSYCYEGSDKWQNAQFLACKVIEEYNTINEYIQLQLNSDRSTKFEGYVNSQTLQPNSVGYAFLGFFRADKDLGLSFVQKKLNSEMSESLPNDYSLNVKTVRFDTSSYLQPEIVGVLSASDKTQFSSSDIAFNFYDDTLVYVVPMKFESDSNLSIQNYIGAAGENSLGTTDYSLSTIGPTIESSSKEMNSFDCLDTCIGVIEAIFDSSAIHQNGEANLYNLHADPSYVPAYSGKAGKTDFTSSSYYSNPSKHYYNVELLGWSKNIDEAIARVDMASSIDGLYDDLLTQLKSLRYGRVFEDYDDNDMSFKIVQSPHLSSASADEYITWNVNALVDSNYIDSHRDRMKVIIYKESTYGKNPYYEGPLSVLSMGESEWKKLYYTNGLNDAEVSAGSIVIAGTYDVYENAINKSESNEIYNIDSVEAHYIAKDKKLEIRFKKHDKDLPSWIAYHDLNIIIIDELDLRAYYQYHFFDPTSFLSGHVMYDFDKNEMYDTRKYKLGTYAEALSAHQLSSYEQLSDVPYLSSYSTLSFKHSEEDVWQLSSPLFYFPGTNDALPSRLCDIYSKYGFSISYTMSELSSLFTQQDLYIVQCTSIDSLTSYGTTQIPLMYFSNSAVRAYESFLEDGAVNEYDVVDPRFFKYVKFSGDAMPDEEGSFSIDLEDKFPSEFTVDTLSASYKLICRLTECVAAGIGPGAMTDAETYVELDTSELSTYSAEDLSKYLNIYVNYKKNEDKKLTLYFNYVNYLNTPYIQKKQTAFKPHIIDNTYLKLDAGENGRLDIVIQLKYYVNNSDIGGFKNITITSYQVYNLSDDKPKFLIAKL